MENEYLTSAEVTSRFGLSRQELYILVKRGVIRYFTKPITGAKRYYLASEIEQANTPVVVDNREAQSCLA